MLYKNNTNNSPFSPITLDESSNCNFSSISLDIFVALRSFPNIIIAYHTVKKRMFMLFGENMYYNVLDEMDFLPVIIISLFDLSYVIYR